MARIVLSGYYGFNNTGDEAVLFSILRTLRSLKPELKFTVLSNDPAKTSKQYGVEAVNRWKLKDVFRALSQADLFISGGGSLLQDTTSPKSILYYLGVVWLAKLMGKPVIYYAQGIGPITSGVGKKLVPLVSNKVDVITVRDQASKELLTELGVTGPPVYVTADAVFSLYHREIERKPGQELLERCGIKPEDKLPMVGISVRQWKNLTGYQRVLARLGDELIRQGYRVVLLPFQFPDDVCACREIARLMQEEPVLIKEQCSVTEMLGVLGELQLVVGMRLHALIMAAVMGVPAVGISYDPKVDSFLKLTEQPNAGRVETLDFEVLSREVFGVLAKREAAVAKLAERVGELRVESRQTAELALNLLK
ncbi:polysaccharide pyruvyl transferase CsaB [Zhaonella formicivorans]|uniref:polysaccharide pyruvyl transferase CsaB n=1 Tax=Zhaonella formicivorans TaxID=2528593 RepID=UPI0010D735DF|nr:polysaccharide pyruvyl transferase CsaB [Zhaonella formicivorans]